MGRKSEFTKYDLYQIISAKDELACYLPPAGVFNDFQEILKFIIDYKKVILKPVDASAGRSICTIEKLEDNFKITDYRKQRYTKLMLSGVEELRNFFKSTENSTEKYIIQKLIKSAKIEQSVFDMRIVMKKSLKDEWECGELEYTLGNSKILITNESKEGYPNSLRKAIQKNYPLKFDFYKVVKQVKKLCERICEVISLAIDYENQFEFEIAIDENSKPWFVEINLFECTKKFKILDYATYTVFL